MTSIREELVNNLNKDSDYHKLLYNKGQKELWVPLKFIRQFGLTDVINEWDSKEKQLRRLGGHKVVLKKLENVESANRSWFEEGKSHLSISNKISTSC
ncbi:unnamed protein product [Rhizophagus irregularis]|nr:unnamed protein product [Rhizophagus irregularis]